MTMNKVRAIKKHRRSLAGIGISSLLIVFVCLAVIIFVVLALVTVRQDLESAKRLAAAQTDYYAADTEAVKRLDKLQSILDDITVIDIDAAASEIGFTAKKTAGGTEFSTAVDINAGSRLCVTAAYKSGKLSVTEWRCVSSSYYVEDSSLPIWDGSTLPI